MIDFKTLQDTGKSLFNAGLAKLERIHVNRLVLQEARIDHNWDRFYDALLNIRSEINERMIKEERENADNYEKKIFNELLNIKSRVNRSLIFEYERYIYDLEYKYGLSMPDKADASEAGDL